MKTKRYFMLIGIIVMFTMAACSNQNAGNNKTNKATTVYTCPMHPEVNSDKPGTCPKCGMDLVIKEISSDTGHQMHSDSVNTMKHN
jgi:PBP1b-binding outer membrane lipoprotein LpoB